MQGKIKPGGFMLHVKVHRKVASKAMLSFGLTEQKEFRFAPKPQIKSSCELQDAFVLLANLCFNIRRQAVLCHIFSKL